jgi:hypothetical protein
MNNRTFANGLAVLGAGLLASSVSSFLETFPIFGNSMNFARGFFDGLSVVAFCVAIVILVRSRSATQG